MEKETLSASGSIEQWMDGSKIAMEYGDFSKIKCKSNVISAYYGADRIEIIFKVKVEGRVYLKLKSDAPQVLAWYKHCVTDVILNPQKYYKDTAESIEFLGTNERRVVNNEESMESFDDDFVVQDEEKEKSIIKKLMGTKLFLILSLIVLPPLGIYLVFTKKYLLKTKLLITILASCYTLFIWLGFLGFNTGFEPYKWIDNVKETMVNTFTNNKNTPTKEIEIDPETGEIIQ